MAEVIVEVEHPMESKQDATLKLWDNGNIEIKVDGNVVVFSETDRNKFLRTALISFESIWADVKILQKVDKKAVSVDVRPKVK